MIAEWIGNGRRRTAAGHAGADLTIAELIAAFWEFAAARYRDADGKTSGELENFRHALRPLKELYGRTPAADFGPRALKAVRAAMLAPRSTGASPKAGKGKAGGGKTRTIKGGCRTYVNRQVGRLKQVFKWAVAEELVPPSVYHGLAAVAGLARGRGEARERPPVRPVAAEVAEAAAGAASPQVGAMIRLQLLTGMRPGEVCSMRGADLDTATRADAGLWIYRPARHKTEHHGTGRVVPLGPRCRGILAPFLRPDLSAYLFSPAEAEAGRREKATGARKTPAGRGNAPGTNRKARPRRRPGVRYTLHA